MQAEHPIAVIGMSCRFPRADGVEAFWRNLVDGRACTGDIPPDRWDAARFAAEVLDHVGNLQAGMDGNGDCYDATFFQLDPEEAKRIDPQQGLALELAWHACEDAGIVPERLAGTSVGVFMGVSTRDFDRRMAHQWQNIDMRTCTGASGSIIANRISYLFGLAGPSLVVESACASSLVSLHMACRAIADGECDMALAGGVQLILSPANMIAFARGGLLAHDGLCKPFSSRADGYVCGEGGGMVMLKSLTRALRDGDRIRAVVLGSAINHNGRSNGLSAPYRLAQQHVMQSALDRSGVAAADVDYVEAHAVGTVLGDAIEMQAIGQVYDKARPKDRHCHVGSVKSNIGHLEAAAGIAGFIKASLMVEQGALPASLHCEAPSGMLRLDKSNLRLCRELTPWPGSPGRRRAAVSAFGFGGTNAHVVLEQPPYQHAGPPAIGPWLLVASAADEHALGRLTCSYAEFAALQRKQERPLETLRDFCATTYAHRRLFALRQIWVVNDWDEAIDALRSPAPAARVESEWRLNLLPQTMPGASAWPSLEASLRDQPAAQRDLLRPIALLARLGLRRLVFEGADASLHIAAGHAARLGVAVSWQPTDAAKFGVPLITDGSADEGHESADFAWQPEASSTAQLVQLCARLLRMGAPVSWPALAALTGARFLSLPCYPFERRRNHVLPDDGIAVPVHGDNYEFVERIGARDTA